MTHGEKPARALMLTYSVRGRSISEFFDDAVCYPPAADDKIGSDVSLVQVHAPPARDWAEGKGRGAV